MVEQVYFITGIMKAAGQHRLHEDSIFRRLYRFSLSSPQTYVMKKAFDAL